MAQAFLPVVEQTFLSAAMRGGKQGLEETPMINPIDQLVLDIPYCTGPLASTDLHAGGVFFCVTYREYIQFSDGGRVRRWREVIDDTHKFGESDVAEIRDFNVTGTYGLNNRNYLFCTFPDVKMTGLPCKPAPHLLAFCMMRPSGSVFGLVFSHEASDA